MIWIRGAVVLLLIVAAFVGGYWVGSPPASPAHEHAEPAQGASTLWTCPMHPEIKLPEFGACPKCGMDLVPMAPGDDTGPRQLAMTPAAKKLAAIETTPVRRQFVSLPVRMVGKVDYDETRMRTIASRVPGRLERLFVDFTGARVDENDHLVELFSAELLTAQAELIEAEKSARAARGKTGLLAESDRRGYEATREKLRLWGLTTAQVDAIIARGTPEDRVMIRSPAAGVVVHKMLNEGDYVREGTPIYRIADLSRLWIRLDAYEQDLPWLRYGQNVVVTAEALPGEVFEGWIAFIEPTLDERTRTVDVRVNVQNTDGQLKPGMFVRGLVQARLGEHGKVLAPRLTGKWISPMHPEIVKDGPGTCDVCGMDLVPAESLGYTASDVAARPLVVPASAVLVTGRRAVVYVELEGRSKPTFEGREVLLGPRAGDHYIIEAGLREHELVVVNGAFRIDSAMQIQAKPSMMSMPGETDSFRGGEFAAFRRELERAYVAYVEVQEALAGDDFGRAREGVARLYEIVDGIDPSTLNRVAQARWQEEAAVLLAEARAAGESDSIERVREHFEPLSRAILSLERAFGHAGSSIRVEIFCPMAFDDQGASWLQAEGRTANPYFGASMLVCGVPRAEFAPVEGEPLAPAASERITGTAAERERVRARIEPIYERYFALHQALAGDDPDAAAAALEGLAAVVESATSDLPEPAHAARAALALAVSAGPGADLAGHRQRLATWTAAVLQLQAVAGHAGAAPLYRLHCPMAFDGLGADWLQREAAVANPYFGAAMPRCGEVAAELEPDGGPR